MPLPDNSETDVRWGRARAIVVFVSHVFAFAGAFAVSAFGASLSAGAAFAGERKSATSGSAFEGGRSVDPRGLTALSPDRRRSPSGLLYPYPLRAPAWADSDFRLRAYAELGWLFGRSEDEEARYREYFDAGDGFWLRRFGFAGEQGKGLGQIKIEGGSVGRNDQFYRVELGQIGRFRLSGRYDALDHTYADDARVLFSGVGGERLNLPAPLVPGDNSQADLNAALAGVGENRIAQSRNESAVELRARLLPGLVWLASYRLERRDGERPFGGTLGTTFDTTNSGSVVETLEPIHSRTHDWKTRLEFSSDDLQANLAYHASLFDNRRESLSWENPFPATDLGFLLIPGEPLGRMALAPDNSSHRVSADVGVRTPLRGRFTASAVWARMQQDERLLPATINPDIGEFLELSRTRANAQVDTLLVQSKWRFRPHPALAMSLRGRFDRRDNDTSYASLNPTTGVYGYVVEDLAPTNRVGSVPYGYRRVRVEADADWSVTRRSKIGIEFGHEVVHRSHRARRVTKDDRARLHWATRALPNSTLRIAYEFRRRTGDRYKPTRDNPFYVGAPGSTTLAGPSRSLQSFQQFDLASHQSHEIDLRSNWLLGPSTDLSLTGRYGTRDYGARYGVQDEQVAEVTLDGTHQPSPRIDLHGFASFEWRSRRFATIDSAPGPVSDLSPGGATFPLMNRWSWDSETQTFVIGGGLRMRPIDSVELSVDYRFQSSIEKADTDFDRTGGALTAVTDPATASRRSPDVRSHDHVLEISAKKEWSEVIATSLVYRLQSSEFEDGQQRGIVPLVNQNLFLAHRDDDYTAHLLGLTATLRY